MTPGADPPRPHPPRPHGRGVHNQARRRHHQPRNRRGLALPGRHLIERRRTCNPPPRFGTCETMALAPGQLATSAPPDSDLHRGLPRVATCRPDLASDLPSQAPAHRSGPPSQAPAHKSRPSPPFQTRFPPRLSPHRPSRSPLPLRRARSFAWRSNDNVSPVGSHTDACAVLPRMN